MVTGGVLSDHKGINRLGGGLSAEALTAKDKADIELVAALDLDYLAVSFPRTAADIDHARALLQQAGGRAGIIAKIERAEAVTAAEDIIQVSDGIMVARGDLGVEIGDAALPGVQKRLIEAARHLNKSVIIATQMMESMIHSSIPTRAEVFDVANAVLDGTDAVMLSAETASGQDPENVVKAMARICLGAEGEKSIRQSQHRIHTQFDQNDEAIAMASMYLANHMGVQAIVCLTESGATPLWMSRIRSGIPILGLSRHTTSLRRMCLFRGVFPIEFDAADLPLGELESATLQHLQQLRWLKPGDQILFTHGDLCGQPGGTNTLKILSVPK